MHRQSRGCFLRPFTLGSWSLARARKRARHGEPALPSPRPFFCFKQHVFVYLEIAIEEEPVGRLLFEVH